MIENYKTIQHGINIEVNSKIHLSSKIIVHSKLDYRIFYNFYFSNDHRIYCERDTRPNFKHIRSCIFNFGIFSKIYNETETTLCN